MNQSRILIIGANGQLGRALQIQYPNARAVDLSDLDIGDSEAVEHYDWSTVDIVLNAAAYTNVDGAETVEGRVTAWQANASAAGNLAKVALEHNLILVHVSTEYVFDGTKNPHIENEPFSPLGVYAQSKAAGDIVVSVTPKHYIVRTSWVIGEGKNFIRTMLDLAKKGVNPTVISDDVGRPTFTSELVRAIDHLLTQRSEFGIYNVSNDGDTVSWADLTRALFETAHVENSVTDITSKDYYADKPQAAARPHNSVFDLTKLHATGFTSRDWRSDLQKYVKKEMTS